MNDNDIKKSIEWHLNSEAHCSECSYKDFKKTNGNCVGRMLRDALDLINLKDDMLNAQVAKIILYEQVIKKKSAEIEKLTVHKNAYGLGMQRLAEQLETAKSEAIKEFAERLKKKSDKRVSDIYGRRVFIEDIDNLVKEMTEQSVNYGSSKTEE